MVLYEFERSLRMYVFERVYLKRRNCLFRKMSLKLRKFFYRCKNLFARKICFYAQRKKVNSLQELVKIKSWLLLIFSIYLHNQLKFHNSRTPGTAELLGAVEPQDLLETWYTHGIAVHLRSLGPPWFV